MTKELMYKVIMEITDILEKNELGPHDCIHIMQVISAATNTYLVQKDLEVLKEKMDSELQ